MGYKILNLVVIGKVFIVFFQEINQKYYFTAQQQPQAFMLFHLERKSLSKHLKK